MERYNPDRSHALAPTLEQPVVAVKSLDWQVAPDETTPEDHHQLAVDGDVVPIPARTNTLAPGCEPNPCATLRSAFDQQVQRLEHLKAGLRQSPVPAETASTHSGTRSLASSRLKRAAAPVQLLHGTRVFLERTEHPPLLPPPSSQSFEEAFKRHEPMFHAVFYRKYAPAVRDDAKQEALLALYRKWLKDKSLLAQSSSYVIQAAIYGVSNWRKKGMKVRGREGPLGVDNHGKVAGEPRRSANERWTDRIDLRLDVARAVECVLHRHEAEPEYQAVCRAVQDVRHDIPLKRGQRASGLALSAYKSLREQVKSDLRQQLAEYAPQPHADPKV